ncbi:MAG: hypothetical protein FJ291_13210 [Planctomycetes bacterium]|nr:hypothetical protein [Planctomycetota bacterium]
MKKLCLVPCALAFATAGFSEHVLREYPWGKVLAHGAPKGARVVAAGRGRAYEHLEVRNGAGLPLTVALLAIDAPPISSAKYAIAGFLRHEGVEGKAYLEMQSHFPGGDASFTRTLAEAGPMRHLKGRSSWRAFALPFQNRPGAPPPAKLVIALVLPGRGTVCLSRLRLAEYRADEEPLVLATGQSAGWWGARTGGLIGGALGALLSCLGAIVGILAGRGKAGRLVLGTLKAMIGLGALLVGAGVVALLDYQPYAVYCPLLLAGVLSAGIALALLPRLRKRYQALRKSS